MTEPTFEVTSYHISRTNDWTQTQRVEAPTPADAVRITLRGMGKFSRATIVRVEVEELEQGTGMVEIM